MKVENLYKQYCSTASDIHEHLPTLLKYGEGVETITEMGVRTGRSTTAWLMAKPKKLLCIDITQRRELPLALYQQFARDNDIDFDFVLADTRLTKIEETDILFIDTLHTYNQLKVELYTHGDKAKKYIILHDTVTFGTVGMLNDKIGMLKAINEFLSDHPEWKEKVHHMNNNGLMVLERIDGTD